MLRAVRFAVLSLLLLFLQQQAYVHPIEHLARTGPHPQETALSAPHTVADCVECALLAGGSHALHGDAGRSRPRPLSCPGGRGHLRVARCRRPRLVRKPRAAAPPVAPRQRPPRASRRGSFPVPCLEVLRVPSIPGARRVRARPALCHRSPRPIRGSPAQLPPVVVTANPLGSDLFDIVPPVAVLQRREAAAQHAADAGRDRQHAGRHQLVVLRSQLPAAR